MLKIKTTIFSITVIAVALGFSACSANDYSGTFTGYAWKDESKGVSLAEASEKIETTLQLNKQGVIQAASIDFLVKKADGSWVKRNDPSATISIDYSITPTLATAQSSEQPYKAGTSMFSISSADKMSLWAVGVNSDGTVAFALVDPIHRYQSELRLAPGFDFSQPLKNLTIGSGLLVPTIRTSSGGYLKPSNWAEYNDTHIFGFYQSTYVYTGRGSFQGLSPESSIAELLQKAGVLFAEGKAQPMAPSYGFFANGGWTGNYLAIGAWLKNKKATEQTSFVDWSVPRYAGAINQDKFFGIDVTAGATRTVQNSTDGIAGATVRMSRESTSYQRALVAAGILTEADVIKGRF